MTRKEIIEKLHRIREQHYEELKDITPKKRAERINREGEEIIKKYGFKFKKHPPLAHS